MILRPLTASALTRFLFVILFATFSLSAFPASGKDVTTGLTTPDKTNLLTEQPQRLLFTKASANAMAIVVDDGTQFRTMDEFGHALTGGTAQLKMKMSPAARAALLKNLAADRQNEPHTNNGGCPVCSCTNTLDGDTVVRNLADYTGVHASKFVPPGSVRIRFKGKDATASLPAGAVATCVW